MASAKLERAKPSAPSRAVIPAPSRPPRVRIDGKVFARDGRPLRIQGVTYGPFAPDADGHQFPPPQRVKEDFGLMQAGGINAIRTYHVPPSWLFEIASQEGIDVFVDVPWPKHLCFLESKQAQRQAREAVALAAKAGQNHASLLAYSIGNEIRPDIVRWFGRRRVERFLAELVDIVKQADPAGLVTYGNYPPTEYLDLSFIDFATFNVYLHDREAFRRYLFRLQNLVGDRPLILGELGMDTMRQGEPEQAHFLAGHVAEARLMGLAGVFVFAWTDDWFTGGCPIKDWAFGITHADRLPKASYHALREVYAGTPADLIADPPRVSVVVCTYNGGRTLEQCLRSLQALDYPDYEILVVDDGSTDDTRAIVSRFDGLRVIHQPNQGLSVARNVGLHRATGDIVAYTDSDCFADRDWLTHLVYQLTRSGADAVGGPNLTPPDGWLAACVAASPGQPTHVLESDQVAEHIPGCNMAFRREALLAINGFDPQFRVAGDDVDVCWRLQQPGMWITFAPGAFVWHHRRQGPRAYLKQQAGYGKAEALLRFKHPDKYNQRGDGKWRGVLYGDSLRGLRLADPIIYHGPFASGMFQCIYQPEPAHWAMLPSTLEWHAVAGALAVMGLFWTPSLVVAGILLVLSIVVAVLQAVQAVIAAEHDGWRARTVVALLCYLQPLVRSWRRYRTRLSSRHVPPPEPGLENHHAGLHWSGRQTLSYWSEEGRERTELLDRIVAYLDEHHWGKVLDSGWASWDLAVYCHPRTLVQICTSQEELEGGKRLLRVRYRLNAREWATAMASSVLLSALAVLTTDPVVGFVLLGLVLIAGGFQWWRGTRVAARVINLVDTLARQQGLIPCESKRVTASRREPLRGPHRRRGRSSSSNSVPEEQMSR